MTQARPALIVIFGALAGAISVAAIAAAPAPQPAPRVTPSGLPVPRYVSLKFADVNARAGPGDDTRLLWVYHAKGLPVQVVAETDEWRRICDPEGGVAWVHKRTTDGRRTVMRLAAQPLPIRESARSDAHVKAYLQSRALAELDRCDKGWCKIKVGGAAGWTPAEEVWGASEAPQCR
ncbi:MAG TPA: SH3 domain-containing protein [Caulobacteraceae bacterium]|nr:SH3 domain-containing protein [Caulobacteraceae bacterium]